MFWALFLGIGIPAIAIGLAVGLYVFLARERVLLLREIRTSADNHSWTFSLKRGYRDPAAFRIHGETFSGLPWNLRTGELSGKQHRCALRLELTFPTMAGDADLVLAPRDERRTSLVSTPRLPEAREFPTGLAEFDSAYKVLAAPGQVSGPVTPALAQRFVTWPKNAVPPDPVAAWRDQSGFHVEAHLPKMSNWATIEYLLGLGEDMCAQLPTPAL